MTKGPLFSVLCTNYNNAAHIPAMVQSLMKQTYSNWELLFVDDASTDNSLSVIREFTDPRIRIEATSINLGAGGAAIKAASMTKGVIAGRLDADDALEPQALQCMVNAHRQHPSTSLITSQIIACTPDLQESKVPWHVNKPVPKDSFILAHPTVGAFATFKTSHLKKTQGFDSSLRRAVDLDIYLKLEEVGEVLTLSERLYRYRANPNGISQGGNGTLAKASAYKVMVTAYHRRKAAGFKNNISRSEARNIRIRQHQIDLHHTQTGWSSLRSLLSTAILFPELIAYPIVWRNTLSSILRGNKTG